MSDNEEWISFCARDNETCGWLQTGQMGRTVSGFQQFVINHDRGGNINTSVISAFHNRTHKMGQYAGGHGNHHGGRNYKGLRAFSQALEW